MACPAARGQECALLRPPSKTSQAVGVLGEGQILQSSEEEWVDQTIVQPGGCPRLQFGSFCEPPSAAATIFVVNRWSSSA